MIKDKKEIKYDEDHFYVNIEPGNKGKVFQEGSGSKGKGKHYKRKVVYYYCKKGGTTLQERLQ